MEVIVLGLISGLRPATSQAAVFTLLRSPTAVRGLLAFVVAGFIFTLLVGLIGVTVLDGAGGAFGRSNVAAIFDLVAGIASIGFAAGVRRGTLDRRRERASDRPRGRTSAAIAARLGEPSATAAATAGVATHIPGLIYLVALNAIAAGKPGPMEALAQVALYDLLWFALPLGALVLVVRSPATATAFLDGLTAWARRHQDALLVVIFGAARPLLVDQGRARAHLSDELGGQRGERVARHEVVGERGAAGALDRVGERVRPLVAHEHGSQRVPRRELRAELFDERALRAAREPPALGDVEPERDQRRDHPAGAATLQLDGRELPAGGVAHDEQHVEHLQGAARLDSLERADEVALETGVLAEAVDQQLHGYGHGRSGRRTQRKPMSQVEVSIVSALRAAGR